jgi:hypothetical protein
MEIAKHDSKENAAAREWKPAELSPVLEALRGMRYGSVEIFIQDYRLVQIDRKEKIRPARID